MAGWKIAPLTHNFEEGKGKARVPKKILCEERRKPQKVENKGYIKDAKPLFEEKKTFKL